MFSELLTTNFINNIKTAARSNMLNERNRYKRVFSIIKKYCEDNKLIISNKYELLDMKDELDNVKLPLFNIYTHFPLRHANNLTNIIYESNISDIDSKYTRMRTMKEKEEFVIDYNFRIVAAIYKIQKHKNGEPYDIIRPVKINNLLYIPSEIEIIDIYNILYNPAKFSEWETNKIFEQKLYDQIRGRKESGILGGNCKSKKKTIIEALKTSIVKNWIPQRKDVVLLGAWAVDWYKLQGDICTNNEKIQIICADDILGSISDHAKTFTNFDITVKEQEMHIPKDFRTKRFTYYVNLITDRGIVEKPFMDVFNCTKFELIPYFNSNGIMLGSPYVQLRFIFIDLWVLRVIKNLQLITGDILNNKIHKLWGIAEFFRSMNVEVEYTGVYRDYTIDKKMSGLNQNKRFFPYYPYLYMRDQKTYRNV